MGGSLPSRLHTWSNWSACVECDSNLGYDCCGEKQQHSYSRLGEHSYPNDPGPRESHSFVEVVTLAHESLSQKASDRHRDGVHHYSGSDLDANSLRAELRRPNGD